MGGRRGHALAVAALAAVIAACTADPLPSDPTASPQGASSQPPTPADGGEVADGWPTTGRNPRGDYAWAGERTVCAEGRSCIVGFMHNGYGSADVEITIQGVTNPEGVVGRDDATAVTIAGHEGFHRQVVAPNGGRIEEWVVDIEGTTVTIRLEAKPGTNQADLDEAHAVIDSMRTEPQSQDPGFYLVFTLETNDWDSG